MALCENAVLWPLEEVHGAYSPEMKKMKMVLSSCLLEHPGLQQVDGLLISWLTREKGQT
ncbi:hypothetical protein PISMIDRAFT_685788 [Pisolithus microcarpus 441]|uniref:Uncharacterized protein n=1 Tax=Pisolithus microcarpus 441 TaxID=765257 RepID=A0A0C9YJQ9_9AGAM|nr:hypothetical protein PISMIDRAFT_685788 [Pisolithus microcarpus 441]